MRTSQIALRVPFLVVALLTALPARAATYFISPSGSDVTGNGTSASPWATPAFAYGQMASGDTLTLKNGTYGTGAGDGVVVLGRWVLPPNGTPAAYTIVRGESFGGVVIIGSGDDNNGSTADPISVD